MMDGYGRVVTNLTDLGKKLDGGARFGDAPPNYVAGAGRGLGDTRREALEAAALQIRKNKRAAALSEDGKNGQFDDAEEDEESDVDGKGIPGARALGDEDGGLFANAVYEEDDVEADGVYAAIEKRMASRRQKFRERNAREAMQLYRKDHVPISQQFVPLKRSLEQISEAQWQQLPESANLTRRSKPKGAERYTPAPDALLLQRADRTSVGASRGLVLGQKLDRLGTHNGSMLSGSTNGAQTSVDPPGYLTEMAGMQVGLSSEIGDIKRARLLMRSVVSTNKKHAPGWIAAARLEENAGNMGKARELIEEGCRQCKTNEDVWIESARLHNTSRQAAQKVLAEAVKAVPRSIKVWLQASTLETLYPRKRAILQRALELIPNSAALWRAAVDLEQPREARLLLQRAVDCAPTAVDLWLALAKLESYESAKQVLNRARQALPAEPIIWITAAHLEEVNARAMSQHSNVELSCEESDWPAEVNSNVERIIQRAVRVLSVKSKVVTRAQWIDLLVESSKLLYTHTMRCIARHALGVGLDNFDAELEHAWTTDADSLEARNCILGARSVHEMLWQRFPTNVEVWKRAADFEKRNSNLKRADDLLSKAISNCNSDELWLLAAESKISLQNVHAARAILLEAFAANPHSESIFLAAVQIEIDAKDFARARSLLSHAREHTNSAQVFLQSALIEQMDGQVDKETELLKEGIAKFPCEPELRYRLALRWLNVKNYSKAIEVCELALNGNGEISRMCRKLERFWICLSDCYEKRSDLLRARAVFDRALAFENEMESVWLHSARLEYRLKASENAMDDSANDERILSARNAAVSVLWRGINACKSGICGSLWGALIEAEIPVQQKARSVDALRKCDQDSRVLLAVARLFWRQRKHEKVKVWLLRAISTDKQFGDAWGALLSFEMGAIEERKRQKMCETEKIEEKNEEGNERDAVENEQENLIDSVMRKCTLAKPNHGEIWLKVMSESLHEQLSTVQILKRVSDYFNPTNGMLPWPF